MSGGPDLDRPTAGGLSRKWSFVALRSYIQDVAFWGDLGSAVGGFATALLVVVGVFAGLPGVRDWRGRQREQRDLAAEQANQIRLDELRQLDGWTPGIVSTFEVDVVTDPSEIETALNALTSGERFTPYVLLRHVDDMRANDFRQLLEHEEFIGRVPRKAEFAALLAGREVLAKRASTA